METSERTSQFVYTTVSHTILGDMYTPVGVFMRLRDLHPQSALMECSDYHDKNNSRSFVCIHPIASVAIAHGEAICTYPDGTRSVTAIDDQHSCDQVMRSFMSHFKVGGKHSELMGLYGYTSFNAVRYFEHIAVKDEVKDRNDAPDIYYILFRDVLVFDHFNNLLTFVTLAEKDESTAEERQETADERLSTAEERLKTLERQINVDKVHPYDFRAVGEVISPLTDEEHKANIRRGIAHCKRGDVFQIVLSRRFIQQYEGDDFKLYRALRSINPSPYLFYFDFGGFRIFGSSPETHCRIEGRR
ncbi:MAG: chorismate-binding protein, partial [Prevotella sp.]|nr:chorismate-binding protein [Prevotella sp.]